MQLATGSELLSTTCDVGWTDGQTDESSQRTVWCQLHRKLSRSQYLVSGRQLSGNHFGSWLLSVGDPVGTTKGGNTNISYTASLSLRL